MKQGNRFDSDMLDLNGPEAEKDFLWRGCKPVAARQINGAVVLDVPFQALQRPPFYPADEREPIPHKVRVRAYGRDVVRLTVAFEGELPEDDSVMLEWDPSLEPEALSIRQSIEGWEALDSRGNLRLSVDTTDPQINKWSDLVQPPPAVFAATVFPDGQVAVPLMSQDLFYPHHLESVGLGFVERNGAPQRALFSVHARHDEKFAGTGERFNKLDLSGQTLALENADGLGVNSRRAYKNVPFYVSSRLYGLLLLTHAHVRLSLADISTRAVQGLVEEPALDLFFFGGGSLERILYNYRRVTGFPRDVPLWSYGTWMSRMTYYSAEETFEVAHGLRDGGFPCDVIHLDTGWFPTDWKCEWEFSAEKFPDPAQYIRQMRELGFRISLWNQPEVKEDNKYFETACASRFLAPRVSAAAVGRLEYGKDIDFSYPEAVNWYKRLLQGLLELGASVIKADFGEEIDMEADYLGMPAAQLHNLYVLLYQKAVHEIVEQTTGEGIIWARGGWTGCQRYPVHWDGDAACTWDGLAGTIRGGLHLGLSGFGFWSHDVPGFHGLPDFMNSWPTDDLYVRWTQMGVFCSHIRYHGTSPREPYHYPAVADIVRCWWRLRYALIPYLVQQGRQATCSGFPLLRALVLHHQDDPLCWHIDDQFYCGDALLVAPVLNSAGARDIYLPEGRWTDLWTGAVIKGPVLLKEVLSPLNWIPVFARTGATIEVYPERVQCTDEMDLQRTVELTFDSSYRGLGSSVLGEVSGLK